MGNLDRLGDAKFLVWLKSATCLGLQLEYVALVFIHVLVWFRYSLREMGWSEVKALGGLRSEKLMVDWKRWELTLVTAS